MMDPLYACRLHIKRAPCIDREPLQRKTLGETYHTNSFFSTVRFFEKRAHKVLLSPGGHPQTVGVLDAQFSHDYLQAIISAWTSAAYKQNFKSIARFYEVLAKAYQRPAADPCGRRFRQVPPLSLERAL